MSGARRFRHWLHTLDGPDSKESLPARTKEDCKVQGQANETRVRRIYRTIHRNSLLVLIPTPVSPAQPQNCSEPQRSLADVLETITRRSSHSREVARPRRIQSALQRSFLPPITSIARTAPAL